MVVEGVETGTATPSSAVAEDDFFSSWDKPAAKPTSSAPQTPVSPPVIGRAATIAPRTITSSSLRSPTSSTSRPASKLGASRLNSSPSTPTTASAPRKSKLGGLGAKKAAAPIDFAEAERKAVQEAERIRQLGYDREKEQQEATEERIKQQLQQVIKPAPVSSTKSTVAPAKKQPLGSSQDMERLGMGLKRLGFGAVPGAESPKAK